MRCAKCGHVWLAGAEGEAGIGDSFENSFEVSAPAAFEPPPIPMPPPEEDMPLRFGSALPSLPPLPRLTRGQSLITCGALTVAILLILIVARHPLVARVPALAHAYAAIGLINDLAGLELDLQLTRAEKCLVSGRDMLCIEGVIVNKSSRPLPSLPIFVTALDTAGKPFTDPGGKPILAWTIAPESGKLLPGETKGFSLTVPYPDQMIADFDYGFTDDSQ